jgi:hypothetical protein
VPTKGTVYIKQVAEENFLSGKGSIINRMDVYYVCESEGYGVLSIDDMVIERLKRVIQIKDNWDDLRSI